MAPEVERRRWPRIPAASLAGWSAALATSPETRLVDISPGGAQLELPARLAPRSAVRLTLTRSGAQPLMVPGRVAWAKLATISGTGQLVFHVGVEFDTVLAQLDTMMADDGAARAADAASVAPPPVVEEPAAGAVAALQARLAAVAREHAEQLAAERAQFEATIAELVRTTDAQQLEYQALAIELSDCREELGRQRELHESQLARCEAAFQQQLADAEARNRALTIRLESTDALCVAQEFRHRALRSEAERLLSLFAVPLAPHSDLPESGMREAVEA